MQIEWQDVIQFDEDLEQEEHNVRLISVLKHNLFYYDIENIWNEDLLLLIYEFAEELLEPSAELMEKYYELVEYDGFMKPWDSMDKIFVFQAKISTQLDRLNSNDPEDVIKRCVAIGVGL